MRRCDRRSALVVTQEMRLRWMVVLRRDRLLPMPLPWREKLAMLLPPATFYRRRIAQEARAGEPELAMLERLVRPGGTAIDIGANQGIFAFAGIAGRVVCFEPNPAAPRPRTPVAPHNGPYRERLITRVKSTRATPLRPVQDNRRLGAQR